MAGYSPPPPHCCCCNYHHLLSLWLTAGLPISFAISWFEQKAVAVLLTLLHLGVKNIALGPNLPAFITPATQKFLSDTFGLRRADVEHVGKDLEKFLTAKH
eukprot:m.18299 g.18299  ORF g.18299 m.18299 type:complete len:101 (-) comp3326_c0_seq1:143-445(-)